MTRAEDHRYAELALSVWRKSKAIEERMEQKNPHICAMWGVMDGLAESHTPEEGSESEEFLNDVRLALGDAGCKAAGEMLTSLRRGFALLARLHGEMELKYDKLREATVAELEAAEAEAEDWGECGAL